MPISNYNFYSKFRKYFKTGGSILKVWIDQVERIINYLPTLYIPREIHVMTIANLPHPNKFFSSLLMETEKDPDRLSLKLTVVDRSRELDQLHEGCYLDQLFLYGGLLEKNELTGCHNRDHLWVNVGLVKFTPMEAARMKTANVVQIPLHTRLVIITIR